MNVHEAIEHMIRESGTSGNSLSLAIGRDRNAVSTILSRSSVPRLDTLAKMCDVMGYSIVLEKGDDRVVIDEMR